MGRRLIDLVEGRDVSGIAYINQKLFYYYSCVLNYEIEFELESRLAAALHNHDFIPLAKVFV